MTVQNEFEAAAEHIRERAALDPEIEAILKVLADIEEELGEVTDELSSRLPYSSLAPDRPESPSPA